MPSETLEYQFEESGLDQLRSDMEDLAASTEDVGGKAENAGSDLEDMGDTDAAEEITSQMEDAQESVSDVGEEATESASQLEEEFQAASDEVQQRIAEMGEEMESLEGADIDVGGGEVASAVTGSAIGAAAGGGSAAALASSLSRAEEPAQELKRTMSQAGVEVEDLEEKVESARTATAKAAGEAGRLSNEMGDAEDKAGAAVNQFRELDIPALGGGGGDGIDDAGDAAAEASGDMGGFAESVMGSRAALMAMRNPVTAVAAGIVAVGTAAATAAKQVADFANAQAEVGQQLKVIEAQSGVSGNEAQELFMIAQRLDSQVDLDTIRDAFKELALRTQEAREGTGEAREAFERLGISMEELENKSTAEIFRKVRQEASDLTKQQRMLTLEQIAGGEAGERLARVFELTANEYSRLKDEVEDESLTSGQIDAMDDMASAWSRVQQDVEDIKNDIAIAFGPTAINSIEAVTSALQRMFDDGQRNSGVSMGPDKNQVDFGSSNEEDTETPEGLRRMREVLSQTKTDIAAVRRKYREGLIPKAEMKRQIESFRQQAADQLIRLKEEFPGIIPDDAVAEAIANYKGIRREVAKMELMNATAQPADATKAPTASPVRPGVQDAIGGIDGEGLAADMQQRAANMERAYKESLSNIEQMAQAVGDNIGRLLARSIRSAVQDLGSGLQSALGKAFGGNERQRAQLKMTRRRLQQEERALRQSLRNREISHRTFQLRRRLLNQQMKKNTQKMAEATQSAWKDAFESLASFVGDIIKQVVSKLVTAITTALALKAIMMAIPGMQAGSIGTLFSSAMGGGGFGSIETNAEGGVYSGPTLGMVGEYPGASSNKEIISPERKMRSVFAETMADMGGMGGHMTVQVQGETRTDGRDLKTSYDKTARIQRRKGRRE